MPKISMPRPVFHCQCGNHSWTALTRGYITLVSPQDSHLLSATAWRIKYQKGKRWLYAISQHKRKKVQLHRLILQLDKELQADHINHNGLDNRRENLRAATPIQNSRNTISRRNSKSRFIGVYWFKDRNTWMAGICINNKRKHLGCFSNEEDAARARDQAAIIHFGEFARLNFPTDERDRSYEAFDHRVESPSALSWQQLALPFSRDPATNE